MTQPAAFSARLLRVRMSRMFNFHANGSMVQIHAGTGVATAAAGFYRIIASNNRHGCHFADP